MQYMFGIFLVKLMWFLHKVWNQANYKGNVRACVSKVDQASRKIMIQGCINNWIQTFSLNLES